jgi:hypothetical protein
MSRRRSIMPYRWPVGVDVVLPLTLLASVPWYIAPDVPDRHVYDVGLPGDFVDGAASGRRMEAVLAVSGVTAACYLEVVGSPSSERL